MQTEQDIKTRLNPLSQRWNTQTVGYLGFYTGATDNANIALFKESQMIQASVETKMYARVFYLSHLNVVNEERYA